MPDANLVVRVSSEQGLSVSGPGHGQALGLDRGLVGRGAGHLGLELLHHVLALQVPDLDDGAGGGAKPVPLEETKKKPACNKMLRISCHSRSDLLFESR